jgi:hypothetical protein
MRPSYQQDKKAYHTGKHDVVTLAHRPVPENAPLAVFFAFPANCATHHVPEAAVQLGVSVDAVNNQN